MNYTTKLDSIRNWSGILDDRIFLELIFENDDPKVIDIYEDEDGYEAYRIEEPLIFNAILSDRTIDVVKQLRSFADQIHQNVKNDRDDLRVLTYRYNYDRSQPATINLKLLFTDSCGMVEMFFTILTGSPSNVVKQLKNLATIIEYRTVLTESFIRQINTLTHSNFE